MQNAELKQSTFLARSDLWPYSHNPMTGPDSPHTGPVSDTSSFDRQGAGGFTMHKVERTREVVRSGVSMGSALAIAISWSTHQSILWAIVHGIFSWLYVIYFAITRN
jgi:hypothetical protein